MTDAFGFSGFEPRSNPAERRAQFDLRRLITENTADIATNTADIATITAALQEIAAARVDTAQGTTSTSYTDLSTTGPAVTLTTGTTALVLLSSLANNTAANNTNFFGVAVSGATTLAASDANGVWGFDANSANSDTISGLVLLTGLTAGSNTFTMKYRVNAGTGTFTYRTIAAVAL